ncbi:MAG TPA: FixH family protein [Anaeromyxobacter sp.]|nr:FixH family protein [Anaeromyxobacter sp.]
MTRSSFMTAVLFTALALLSACNGSQNGTSASQKTRIGTTTAGAFSVELLGDAALSTGLNSLSLRITEGGTPVTDATVTVTPVMTMSGGMQHSCPIVGAPTLGSDGLYQVQAVFQMASGTMGTWAIHVGITRPGAAETTGTFADVAVSDSGRAKVFAYTDPSTSVATKYVASLSFKAAPKVGLNPIEVTLHRMDGMMAFSPVTDAAIALDPQMPSMGHGSPGSVDPAHVSDGRYDGQLSFSMAGEWETTVTFSRAAVTLGAPVFATTF